MFVDLARIAVQDAIEGYLKSVFVLICHVNIEKNKE